jgi:nucleoside-diphosphate-sugar epimerase
VPISHLIITGGDGYLGSALLHAAWASGWQLTVLSRSATHLPSGVRHMAWRLGEPLPAEALDPALPLQTQALVHLAHDWNDHAPAANSNLAGARVLRDDCRRLGIGRVVFASSQSARADALNAYGKLKWQIEQLFDGPREISLRIGLVYGGRWTGQYGLLCRVAMATSVAPMVAPEQLVQPIHLREVARGILLAVDSNLAGVIGLALPRPIPFSEFLDTLAWRLRGGRLRLVRLPLGFVLRLCAIANTIPFMPSVDRERVLGLAGTRASATADDLKRLGLELMPFAQGMADEPAARRALLREGRALLRYVLRAEPGGALIRRYAYAIQASGSPGAMRLSRMFVRMPRLMRCIEPLHGRTELARRLRIVLALADASPEGARALGRGGGSRRFIALCGDGVIELVVAPLRLAMAALRP